MYKDVVNCSNCKHFVINPDKICMCNNEKGLAFPNSGDYCSYAELSDEASREINNSELLKLVYQQRRNG